MTRVICFDLDDTLCKEIDCLKSAFREIAEYSAEHCHGCSVPVAVLAHKAYDVMIAAYQEGQNAFDVLNSFLGLDLPIADYLYIYRNHKPKIALCEDVDRTLDALKAEGVRIGLITDGRSVQQRNKIKALGLGRWIENADIVVSEEFGSEKPALANYEYFMKRYPECHDFTYVGDNPRKDFIAPNSLGWMTICLKDDGRNIHRQEFSTVKEEAMAKRRIETLLELID
ncbi:HAD family hydrolase [Segatella copri]|uniref:Haloacid dehalogenase-like hydrolase n=1 Tax=Segatella copri DSM 18205 TaxID=537011 RepID=D1PFD4_9BACT|nr:HAD family hydrolase [Segatella copri]EFB34507.1 haloacid dehalogenase-like hydrolase [Segatella copri DSM 18205]MCW4097710.1 HAD family hydrolase [Segatella copri]MQP20700.1 HAD family hydrolase [Segatella copri DSM 18205]UEA44397.1 HAD family hydrolase [Segatella copri DSM 18205]